MKYLFVIMCCLSLVACGGGGGGGGGDGAGIDPRLGRLEVYAAQNLRVLGSTALDMPAMPRTPENAVPDNGAIDFTGSVAIRVEVPSAPLVLFGDATITLDFDLGASTGTMSDIFGETAGGGVSDYVGEIDLVGGPPDRSLSVEYAGTVSADGVSLRFDGTLAGELLGDPVGALAIADLEAEIVQDGNLRSGTVVIIAEGQAPPPPMPPDPSG